MKTLEEIYTAEWFAHDFAELQPEFNVVADALYRQFKPSVVADIGCGPGMVLRRLREHGASIFGIEGSQHGIDYAAESVRDEIIRADITTMDPTVPLVTLEGSCPDLVICTEVLEHVHEEHADRVVALLCSAMCTMVVTAAPPGQDGHHHVNCQPPDYWLAKFAAHGALLDERATLELKRRWKGLKRLSHMSSNLLVIR